MGGQGFAVAKWQESSFKGNEELTARARNRQAWAATAQGRPGAGLFHAAGSLSGPPAASPAQHCRHAPGPVPSMTKGLGEP